MVNNQPATQSPQAPPPHPIFPPQHFDFFSIVGIIAYQNEEAAEGDDLSIDG
jgi:hypothetical protein